MAQITMYKTREQVVTEMLAELQGMIPDVYVGTDGVIRIIFEIEGGQFENAFLANQLVLQDMFIATASLQGLMQHGNDLGVPMKEGVRSAGTVTFEGDGGTYIPIGTEVAYDAGSGADPMYFVTTLDGSIPNPGTPSAPVAALGAAGGLTGTYEYRVTFVTAAGETLASADSNAISPAAQQVNLTNIPVGGPGTLTRRIYRDKNGANNYRLVTETANNTSTTFTDNVSDATVAAASAMPTVDTARRITLAAQSSDTGADTNVLTNTITEIVDAPASISAIVASSAFTGGSEPEDTESYRQRLLDYSRNPQTGSPADLQTWAESVAGVESASVFTNNNLGVAANGHATIRITSTGGSQPSAQLITDVSTYLTTKDLANITLHIAGFNSVTLPVAATVVPSTSYTLSDVSAQVAQAITNYITSIPVGGTFYVSAAIAAIMELPSITDAHITNPASNQTSVADQKFVPGAITVS